MRIITEEYQDGIEELLSSGDMYQDAELSTDALIEHIIKNGDPKKRFGVLYEKIVNNVDTPIELKYFGSFLKRDDAKKLAVHFIIEQEESDKMIEHGDAIATEELNYFKPMDDDAIDGMFQHLA